MIIINNARIFDGEKELEENSIIIDNNIIKELRKCDISTKMRSLMKKQIEGTWADSIQGYKYRDSCKAILHSVSDNHIAISNMFIIEQ